MPNPLASPLVKVVLPAAKLPSSKITIGSFKISPNLIPNSTVSCGF